MCVFLCCVWDRDRERQRDCVCERERHTEKETMSVWERDNVCVREREILWVCECMRERERGEIEKMAIGKFEILIWKVDQL